MRLARLRAPAVAVVGCAMAVSMGGCGAPNEVEVVQAARAGLEAAVPGVEVGQTSGWDVEDGCAVVQFETSRGIDKVAVVRDASGTWVMRRVATDAAYFDIDGGWQTVGCAP